LAGPKTREEKLSASGTLALSQTEGGSGAFFGWFNSKQSEGGGRPVSSLGFHFDGERGGGRLAVRLIGRTNEACGTFVTPFVPGKYRPTPIRNDGTRYAWTLDYDPDANAGLGQFRVTVRGNGTTHEEWEGKEFTVNLPPGLRQHGATFDRFGLMNATKPGGVMTIHFADLRKQGVAVDLNREPAGWVGVGNRATYEEPMVVGAHDFGYRAGSNFAGGKAAGELGGDLWRSGPYAYYADRVGPLDLQQKLEARGQVVLAVGAPDSDMYLGWFGSEAREQSPAAAGNFVGVHVGGPTRVGHYFAPVVVTGGGTKQHVEKGPVLVPGRVYEWSLVYDPAGAGGNGEVTVKLGEELVTLKLKKGVKGEGARLDRFGLFTSTIGGQLVRIYLDDLRYTAGRGAN
jgi:hypothetical protein